MPTHAVVPSEVSQLALQPVEELPAPVTLLERVALDPNANVEKLERLIAMNERVMESQGRAAFNAAFCEMQGEIPVVIERAKTNNGTYAPLEDIQDVVRPILKEHGFSLSFKTEWPDARTVRVIGILTHRDGHERTSEFISSADSSGNKNAIQGFGSAVTYGRRYTTKDLLNITTRGADDDGQATGRPTEKKKPAGIDDLMDTLTAAADNGPKSVTEVWNAAKPEQREWMTANKRQWLDAQRAKARAVKP